MPFALSTDLQRPNRFSGVQSCFALPVVTGRREATGISDTDTVAVESPTSQTEQTKNAFDFHTTSQPVLDTSGACQTEMPSSLVVP